MYLLDASGNQTTELDGAGAWQHTNVWLDGHISATYTSPAGTHPGLHFYLADPLGTRRVQAAASGAAELYCLTLPWGNALTNLMQADCVTPGNVLTDAATEHNFTGKERDSESGNDYFGKRYYASSMGRWLSPDESLDGAIMELPQTWNKYSYEYNRPLYGTDPDGRCPPCIGAIIGGVVEGGFDLGKQLYNNGGSLSKVSWGEVGANAAGGAVAGALAGATGGTSLLASGVVGDLAAGTTSGIVGGIVTRDLDPNTSADDVLSGTAVSEDALGGFVGGGAGHVASEFVHIPDDPTFHFNGRNGSANNQAYRQALRDLRSQNTGAYVNQGIRSGISSSAATHTTNGLYDWMRSWFFNGPHCHTEQVDVTINGVTTPGTPHQVCE